MLTRRQFADRLALGASLSYVFSACRGVRGEEEEPQPELPSGLHARGPVRVQVKPAARLGDVSPLIYGAAVEWTENGNTFFDPGRGALRRDALDLLVPLRVPVWRFPGGIMADHYHWRDGIGPQAARPSRPNPMDGTTHANTFGTDEFIEFTRALSAEPLITANVGTGTFEEIDGWRRHFDAAGRPLPYIELGNEIYLAEPRRNASIPGNDDRIYHTPAAYADKAGDWARRLRAAGCRAMIGGIAGTTNTSRENSGWLDVLLERAAQDLDFVALHNAFAPLVRGDYDFGSANRRRAAYRAMSSQAAHEAAADTREVKRRWQAARGSAPRIAITEHFPLFGFGGGQAQLLAILDQSRTMAAAIYTAGLFHTFMREGVWMANYNVALSKWFGALLTDTPDGLVRTPTYHTYDLYRNRLGQRLIETQCTSPRVRTAAIGAIAAADTPLVDAIGTLDDSGAVILSIIGRHFDDTLQLTIDGLPAASVDVWTLSAGDPSAITGPRLSPTTQVGPAIEPKTSTWNYTPGTTRTLPPNSITLLRWPAPRSGSSAGSTPRSPNA